MIASCIRCLPPSIAHPRPPPCTAPSVVRFDWVRGRLFDHLSALVLFEMCVEDGVAVVESVAQAPKSKWKPIPLATVGCPVRCSCYGVLPSPRVVRCMECESCSFAVFVSCCCCCCCCCLDPDCRLHRTSTNERVSMTECVCVCMCACVRGVVQIELQKRASRHLKMSSKETMDVAEKLYQAGWGLEPNTHTCLPCIHD
jgi:hypothetical protein